MLKLIGGSLFNEHLLFVTSLNISHFTRYELLKLSFLYKFALSHSKARINHFATTDITHFLLELCFLPLKMFFIETALPLLAAKVKC